VISPFVRYRSACGKPAGALGEFWPLQNSKGYSLQLSASTALLRQWLAADSQAARGSRIVQPSLELASSTPRQKHSPAARAGLIRGENIRHASFSINRFVAKLLLTVIIKFAKLANLFAFAVGLSESSSGHVLRAQRVTEPSTILWNSFLMSADVQFSLPCRLMKKSSIITGISWCWRRDKSST